MTENSVDWYFHHQGNQIDETMFTDFRDRQESIDFEDDFYASNDSDIVRAAVVEIDEKGKSRKGKVSKHPPELRGVVNASRQIWYVQSHPV